MTKNCKCNLKKEAIVTWLECEMVIATGKKMVKVLKYSICSKNWTIVESSRDFSDKWIVCAKSLAPVIIIISTTEKTNNTCLPCQC